MKMKVLISMPFMSLAVIAFAAPPPDVTPVFMADNVQQVVQDYSINTSFDFTTQNVAFVDIGDWIIMDLQENSDIGLLLAKNETDEINVFQDAELYALKFLPEPVLLKLTKGLNSNDYIDDYFAGGYNYMPDRLCTNYGYPFTANSLVFS